MSRARAKLLSSKTVFQGKVFDVRVDQVVEPGGVQATREVVTHHGSVVLLPVLRDANIILVRQYRHTVGDFLWEIPAGRIERGESPLAAAKRELAEETGYRARRLKLLMDVYPTPGFVAEHMYLYAATGLTAGGTNFDADERIETRPFPLATLLRMIRARKIHDAKSVAGILFYAYFLHRDTRRRSHRA
ncbi:MAG TPA: NUDIX hydrolase [Candidatus Acidoferrales bacterium]|nr:NUDIX hydrolase [Candidatus Acidoferrales bacterium]